MTLSNSAALANLARIGKLKAEPPDALKRAGLLRSAADPVAGEPLRPGLQCRARGRVVGPAGA